MSSLPFKFQESTDGTISVEGIIQRAFNSRGVDGELYTQEDLGVLSQLIINNPALAEHGRDSVCGAKILGRVTDAKILGKDLHITTTIRPPPETPEEIYRHAKQQLSSGKWKAYSIRWFALNDPATKKTNPDKRIPIEVSLCEEPHFGYARFTSVTASAKHSAPENDPVLTLRNDTSHHKTGAMELPKETVYELLKAGNPDLPADFLDNIPAADYGKVLAAGAKRAIEERNQIAEQLKVAKQSALTKRSAKAQKLTESFKSLVDESEAQALNDYLTKELPVSDKWGVMHKVLARCADDRVRLDSMEATAVPETTALAAAKRKKVAPEFEETPAVAAKQPETNVDQYTAWITEAWGRS